ncbi:MAG: DUF4912 domain-containing protein, partial [Brevinematales bacterium]
MTKTDLQKKTKAELLELAREKGIEVGASATKDVLIDKILSAGETKTPTKKSPLQATKKAPSRQKTEPIPEPHREAFDPITAGESKKFEIEDYRQVSSSLIPDLSDIYDIPESYNENRLTLLVQDPYWIHAYWDLSQETKQKLQSENLGLVIRLFYGEKQTMDIEVNFNAKNWYINVPLPNVSYRGELGYVQHGVFISITGSNSITVPRDKPAEKTSPTTDREISP